METPRTGEHAEKPHFRTPVPRSWRRNAAVLHGTAKGEETPDGAVVPNTFDHLKAPRAL